MINISQIHERLGLNLKNGLFVKKSESEPNSTIEDLYDGDFSEYKSDFKTEYALKKLEPHSFFVFNKVPLILFFDRVIETEKKLCSQIWNFNKSALAFVNNKTELVIYNGFDFDKKKSLLSVLATINNELKLEQIDNYSYWNIVSSELWNSQDTDFKNKSRVDKVLLQNITTVRNILIDAKEMQIALKPEHVNRIIARLIFVRYLIDRNINLDYNGRGKELLTKAQLPELILQKDYLFEFFDYLAEKFKGNLLPINGERDAIEPEHLQLLSSLFKGDRIKSRETSLFNIFDFDFIPVEFISNIYETFLGEKQDADKAFYTPPFLVDYILEQTVKPHIERINNLDALSCKTADFTCGSGIFLCETLRTIINRYIELENPDKSSTEYKSKIKQLLVDNIYGNDINKEATEIAKFSLFITLLDYFEDPKDIEGFEFPDVSNNFFNYDVFKTELNQENNSFVSDLDNLFGENKAIELDFIIGNPPWGKLEKKSPYIEYIKNRKKKENNKALAIWQKQGHTEKFKKKSINISNNEFAQAFLLRLSDFSSKTKNTSCQVIVTSKLLYNLHAHEFRSYLLNNFILNEVLELSSVRHLVFSGAVGPAAIIKYQYAFDSDTKENAIDYVSLKPNPYFAIFKSILIEKYDCKEVVQSELIKNDWLWKVLVYGHILDYRFVERLRNRDIFPDILGELIEDEKNKDRPLFASTGIILGKKQKYFVPDYYKMYFINTNKKISDLQRFYIHYDNQNKWEEKKVDRQRDKRIFINKPLLLIKIGFTLDFKLVSSISHIPAVYTKSIYGIINKNNDNCILENLLALVNSDLMSIYMLLCGSSIGVEREQLINEELFPFPVVQNPEISIKAKHLIVLNRLIAILEKSACSNVDKKARYQQQFKRKEDELNELIFRLYHLSETEKDLISYAQEITIPILQAKKKDYIEIYNNQKLYKPYKKNEKSEIEAYLEIFKEHFNKSHNGGDNGYFNVDIIQSKNILACEFSVDNEKREDKWIFLETDDKALDQLVSLGFQKVSNALFIQKDIKIIRSDSFAVAKPNQYKYWHKAVARLDVIEFMEAMIDSRKGSPNA